MNPKVPKYIKNKMRLLAMFSRRANELSEEINSWFESQGYIINPSDSEIPIDNVDSNTSNDISTEFLKAPIHIGDIVYYVIYANGLYALECMVLKVNISPNIKANIQLQVCDERAIVNPVFGRIYAEVFENIGKRLFFSKEEANKRIASLLSKEA